MEGAIDWTGGEASAIKIQTNNQNSTLTELFQRLIKSPLLDVEEGSVWVYEGDHRQCEKLWFSNLEYFLTLKRS